MGVVIVVWGERKSEWKKVRMCHKQWGAKEGRKRVGERKDERRVLVFARSSHTKEPRPPGHGDMDARTVRTWQRRAHKQRGGIGGCVVLVAARSLTSAIAATDASAASTKEKRRTPRAPR